MRSLIGMSKPDYANHLNTFLLEILFEYKGSIRITKQIHLFLETTQVNTLLKRKISWNVAMWISKSVILRSGNY